MDDWQEFAQAIFIGLLFAFLVSKLISLLISFRDAKIRLVREEDLPVESDTELKSSYVEKTIRNESTVDKSGAFDDDESDISEEDLGFNEQQSVVRESLSEEEEADDDDDDDWEGVESTELDEAFDAATTFVAAAAADRLSQKVSNEVQLQLYGFYKIATEGPCRIPQPSALKMSARAKWNAWQRLGSMPPEEAMQKYIVIVNELYPTWASGSTIKKDGPKSEAKGPMGPVFSSFIYEEDSGSELKLDAIHDSAREGEVDNVLRCIESGVSVNLKDSEGRTPLHWAVDRGHLNVVELLIDSSAHINAKDNEGQTALHYAVVCEREGIAEFLVKHNADIDAKDIDGSSPCDLCELNWPWMCNSSSTEVIY